MPSPIYGMPSSMAFRAMGMGGGGYSEGGVGAIGQGLSAGVQALMSALQYNKDVGYRNSELALRGRQTDIEAQRQADYDKQVQDTIAGNRFERVRHGSTEGQSVAAQPQAAAGAQPSSLRSPDAGASVMDSGGGTVGAVSPTLMGSGGGLIGTTALRNAQSFGPPSPQQGADSQTRSGQPVGQQQAAPYDPNSDVDILKEREQEAAMDRRNNADITSRQGIASADLSERNRNDTLTHQDRQTQIAEEAKTRRAQQQLTATLAGDRLTDQGIQAAQGSMPVKSAAAAAQAITKFDQAYHGVKQGYSVDLEPATMSAMSLLDNAGAGRKWMLGQGIDPNVPNAINQHFQSAFGNPAKIKQLDQLHNLVHGMYGDLASRADASVSADSAAKPFVNPGAWQAVRSQYQLPDQQSGTGGVDLSPQAYLNDTQWHSRNQAQAGPGTSSPQPTPGSQPSLALPQGAGLLPAFNSPYRQPGPGQ